jgi:RNA polymerase sigma-B factor
MGTTLVCGAGSGAGTCATEAALFAAVRDGDRAARDALVARFLPMARRLAWRYRHGGEPIDDLVQVASVGLVKALERFDPARGVPFSAYAVPTIVGELKRHLRDTRWAAYVPQRMRERVLEVDRAAESLRGALGRSPTAEELAREARLEAGEVAEALQAATAYDAVSLDTPAHGSRVEAGQTLLDLLGTSEHRYERVESAVTSSSRTRADARTSSRSSISAWPPWRATHGSRRRAPCSGRPSTCPPSRPAARTPPRRAICTPSGSCSTR